MSATGIEIPIVSTYKDKGAKAASKSLAVLTKSAKELSMLIIPTLAEVEITLSIEKIFPSLIKFAVAGVLIMIS